MSFYSWGPKVNSFTRKTWLKIVLLFQSSFVVNTHVTIDRGAEEMNVNLQPPFPGFLTVRSLRKYSSFLLK